MKNTKLIIVWLTLFSIVMGYLETSVVVYLRELYYPARLNFPLQAIQPQVGITQLWREVATTIMLWSVSIIAGRNRTERFAFFLYSIAIWDLFYYLFLKILLDWPATLLTWDILFLIPLPRIGPVAAPCLVSLLMILLTLALLYLQEKRYKTFIQTKEWALLISGSFSILFSFIHDYLQFLEKWGSHDKIWILTNQTSLFTTAPGYVPQQFLWLIFCTVELLILIAIVLLIKRTLVQTANKSYKPAPQALIPNGNFADYLDGL